MSVRIYALAKELKIDSKELVDICTRAGIPGKGSALASLTEDEVTKVKQFLDGGSGGSSSSSSRPSSKAAAPAMERPQRPASRDQRMKVVVTPKPASPLEAVKAAREAEAESKSTVADSESPEQEQPQQEQAAPESPAEETTTPAAETKESVGDKPGPLAGMVRREDYIGPGSSGSKMPVVGGGDSGNKSKKPKGQQRARPAVKLAPLPPPSEATPESKGKKQKEAPALKPDMRLPADVLGAGKLGSKPLADHMRRAERTLDEERARRGGKESEDDDSSRKARGRRGRGAAREEGATPMLGGREQRQLSRGRSAGRRSDRGDRVIHRRGNRRRTGVNTAAPRKDKVSVQLPCTVRDLSEAAGVQAVAIMRILMEEGVMAQINDVMDVELTELVAAELGVDVDFVQPETLEDKVLSSIRDIEDPDDALQPRPPVITFLGHVDHGKTSLIDKIIGIDVAGGESGGITQHIRAYQIEKDGAGISFVDTPGHEAFTEMRARGANVTDIAVLVVAADDGVMPQTEEAISHAKAAEVPIVVALNKIDIPGIDPTKAMADLSANGLQPSEWGGDVEVVKTSAMTGEGIDELLETILTVADLHEYKANPDRAALGTSLESQQQAGQGVLATVVVQNGTLRVGDNVVCGDAFGKVRAMTDTLRPDVRIEEAGPSTPVNLLGFDKAPPAGEGFYVLDDIAQAREIAESRVDRDRMENLGQSGPVHVTLENLFDRLEDTGEVQTLNLILRADMRGSIEAIKKELTKLEHPEVKLRVLQALVGGVTEGDIQLANASDAIVLAFNVVPDDKARSLADKMGVQIRRYSVIYKITDELKASLEGMLRPEEKQVELGRALVQQLFKISRVGTVAGCRVIAGAVERNARARVVRDSTIIGDYPIDTLRREKDDAKEVREGYECGIKLSGYNDLREGDLFEVYKVEEVSRKFDD